jgi:hypothetical protein
VVKKRLKLKQRETLKEGTIRGEDIVLGIMRIGEVTLIEKDIVIVTDGGLGPVNATIAGATTDQEVEISIGRNGTTMNIVEIKETAALQCLNRAVKVLTKDVEERVVHAAEEVAHRINSILSKLCPLVSEDMILILGKLCQPMWMKPWTYSY